jgi:hypothetical protein
MKELTLDLESNYKATSHPSDSDIGEIYYEIRKVWGVLENITDHLNEVIRIVNSLSLFS